MGITNNIPPSRLIQPGVIDNAAARPASPFEGQTIFQKDTDQLLVWNGTAWVIPNAPAQNPMGLELITTGVLSTATTNFQSCFTSTYRNYRVIVDSPTMSSAGDFYIRYLTGTSTPSSGSNYYWAYRGINSAAASADNTASANAHGYMGWSAAGAGGTGGISVDIYQPNLAVTTIATINASSLGSGVYVVRNGQVAWDAATVFTGFQITSAGAATLTGNVSIYGYRNS